MKATSNIRQLAEGTVLNCVVCELPSLLELRCDRQNVAAGYLYVSALTRGKPTEEEVQTFLVGQAFGASGFNPAAMKAVYADTTCWCSDFAQDGGFVVVVHRFPRRG